MTQEFVVRVRTAKQVFGLDVLKAITGQRRLPESVEHVEIAGVGEQPTLGHVLPKRTASPVRGGMARAAGGKT